MIKPIIFGKFILLERINVGGMAEVYRAKLLNQPQFGRYFAIKRMLPNLAKDEEFVSMFINEAKVAVELEHPNVCQIYELGRLENSHYIAMEYISGRDIEAIQSFYRKQRKIMSVSQACYIIAQGAQGLDYAHKAVDSKTGEPLNLIHRDVTPQNLIADFSGVVKLIDFGVAKATKRNSNTQSGVLKGKFSYMSPEQADAQDIDHRSDIFALGVIFWELLTGRRLFVSESEYAILEMIKECNIEKPSKYNKMVPDVVDRICMKALAKDKNQRYAWASDMIADLFEFINSCEPPYTMWHLSTWLQKTYDEMYAEEKRKFAIFDTINTPEDVERYNRENAEKQKQEQEAAEKAAKEKAEKEKAEAEAAAKAGENPEDSKAPDAKKEEKKAEVYDIFDDSIELTPEGIAPEVSDPEHLRMKQMKKRAAQRKALSIVVVSFCAVIVIGMILLMTGIIPLPGPTANLPTDASLKLTLLPDIEAAKVAQIDVYKYPKEQNPTPVYSAKGGTAQLDKLEPSRYAIYVEMDGYDLETFTVNIEAGTSESRLEMTHQLPVPVDYNVNVSPEEARLYLNGELVRDSGPVRHIEGKENETVTLKATCPGYAPVVKNIKVQKNSDVSFNLEKHAGEISIKSNQTANVFICDGAGECVDRGVTGATPLLLDDINNTDFKVTVEVRAEGYKTWSKQLAFEDQVSYKLFADLEPEN